MNRIMLKAVAIALPMMLGTAIADDTQPGQDALNGVIPMNYSELALVTGAGYKNKGGDSCFFCSNYAEVYQKNVSKRSDDVYQSNNSFIIQSIN